MPARDDRSDRRVAEAAGVGRGGADPVPRERRRQPRADGLQHAAAGGAADPRRGAAASAPAWRRRVARDFGRDDHRAPLGRRRPGRRDPHRRPRHRGDIGRRLRRRHLQPAEVPALEPEHLHQPAAAGDGRRRGAGRRHHRRRAVDRARRAGARAQRAVRVHAVERLQFRGFDPDLRADRVATTSSPRSISRSSR